MANPPLIAFAGGGTGGHLYPALAVAEALQVHAPDTRLLFFATQRPLDRRIIRRAGVDLIEQPLVSFGRMPWRWPAFLLGFHRSARICRASFAELRPSVVVGTGGLGSIPAVREAARAGIATAILNPDSVPGRANRHLASRVDTVFAQWPETVEHFARLCGTTGPRVLATGCPVRPEFGRADRRAGITRFDLNPNKKTFVITGASQGARNINRAVIANLDLFESPECDWQIIHLTGENDHGEVVEAYRDRSVGVAVLPYTEHMADALAAADLLLGRAGASSLAEITAVGRAAILMPYPYHRDQHQLANARCLERVGAARVIPDRINLEQNGPALRETLKELMADAGKRGMMAEASRQMGRESAASSIAKELLVMAS